MSCGGNCGCGNNDFDDQMMYENDVFFAKVGQKAPLFECDGYHKGEIDKFRLGDFRGKWVVLFFYPLDFTFVCPTEIVELSKRAKEFEEIGAEVLYMSVDSPHSHKAWCKELGQLHWPMLSDMTHEVSEAYDVYLEDKGISLRGSFIIDPDGVLQAKTVHNLEVGRSCDEVLRVLKAFQTGELCPVNWKPGSHTLGEV